MFRKPFRFWLITLLLGPAYALALEIGEIQVQSSLNQLFDARISLPKLTPEDLAKVSVKLAPAPMYKEFGLDRTGTLGKLVFSIEYNAEGEVYVRVVSTEPIREPSLGLLMEFSWPRGKTFREFTVFLDPVQRLVKRPNDRTKTVLDGTAQAASPTPVASSVPTVAAAVTPESTPSQTSSPPSAPNATVAMPAPVPVSEPATPAPVPVPTVSTPASPPTPAPVPTPVVASPPSVATTTPTEPLLPPVPVETVAAPVKGYKAGSMYGPVMPGERLGKIALKVRPDPNVTPEQMAQALFKANPEAFAKSGINELKVGSTLRLPTLRQIAKFSGSETAKKLAEAEEAQAAALARSVMVKGNGMNLGESNAGAPQAFALTPPDALEPMMVDAAPSLSALLEPVKSGLEAADKRELVGASSAKRATAIQPSSTVGHLAPPILAPVSATPLTYLAVAEVIGTAVKIPGSVIPAQIAPTSIIADVSSNPSRRIPKLGVMPTTFAATAKQGTAANNGFGAKAIVPAGTTNSVKLPGGVSSPSTATGTTNLLGALEGRVGELAVKVDTSSRVPSITQSDKMAQAMEVTYKGGEQYGPVGANERLWDIATKVRPDAEIGKDVMMKALFLANPQAFSGREIDHMKEGALLRVPTLEEIVKHTGSPAAKELLERQVGSASSGEGGQETGTSPGRQEDPKPVVKPTQAPDPTPSIPPTGARSSTTVATSSAVIPPPPLADIEKKVKAEPTYRGGEQYGPVGANERLWDIAAKVLPDAEIGKEVMVKALFLANPQAFSGRNIDHMKEGALLRVPTLEEIVKHTGSPAAKELLERQAGSASSGEGGQETSSNPDRQEGPKPAVKSTQAPDPTPNPSPASATSPTTIAEPTGKISAPPLADAEKKVKVAYKGGEQYGPVGANERLWDIAAKVLPDAEIGKEVMVKALFLANPQAFSGRNIDHMKEGALLRVPTLEEIVKHTGSPAAKGLLEKGKGGAAKPVDPPPAPVSKR